MTDDKSLVPARGMNTLAFEPNSPQQLMMMCEEMMHSGLIPKSIRSSQALFLVLIQGRELGLTVMQSLKGVHIVEGRPAISSQLMMGLVLRSGKAEYFRLLESTAEAATYETKRKDEPEPVRLTWDIAKAKKANLLSKFNWKAYPEEMLRARCASALCRERYPDVCAGLYTPDEAFNDEREPELYRVELQPESDEPLRESMDSKRERRDLIKRLREAKEQLEEEKYRELCGGRPPSSNDELRDAVEACEAEIAERKVIEANETEDPRYQ